MCVCVCLNPRLCEMRFGFFSKKGISYSMFFALLRKRKKDERKKKFLVPTDVFEFFFGRREVKALPVRFSSEFVGFHFRFWATNSIRTLVVFCVAQAEPSTFQTKKIAAQKERARALFEFFFVCKGWSTRRVDYYYARIHSHTRKGRRDARVLLLHFLRARALVAVNLNPSQFFFFFQTITF